MEVKKMENQKKRSRVTVTCYECKKMFCFDEIWGGQLNNTMGEHEKIRDVCSKCRKIFKYFTVGSKRINKNNK